MCVLFFIKQKTAYELRISDWSSDVCSSDLEVRRTLDALRPYVEAGVPVVGLEPACLLSLRDEFVYLLPGDETTALSGQAFLFEEFLLREHEGGRLNLELRPIAADRALMHGPFHQKSFGLFESAAAVGRSAGRERGGE